jgi:P-loop containing NTP hydrolase pore-1
MNIQAAAAAPAVVDVTNADEAAEETSTTETIYTLYENPKFLMGGEHPCPLVQSASMACVDLPDVVMGKLSVSKKAFNEGKLSCPQLETIVYAAQSFEQDLPTGERAGFFLGDSGLI